MCGEHTAITAMFFVSPGSSPHVRGALQHDIQLGNAYGIIPACAGSTRRWPPRTRALRDHPRMCGEHVCEHGRVHPIRGSSPHVRGAPNLKTDYLPVPGIIPACAGSTLLYFFTPSCQGIIPACAGSTTRSPQCLKARWDHPRMCGEHISTMGLAFMAAGSSPHVRGARGRGDERLDRQGIIPACAGSTVAKAIMQDNLRDHPRMCGEHFLASYKRMGVAGSSPHVRGAPPIPGDGELSYGIIPACAGSTSSTGG